MVEDTKCTTNANVKTKADTEAIFSTSLYNESFSREHCRFGVQQDAKTAVELYKQAADQGNDDAQHALGECYDCGHGVAQDKEKALEWFKKAANNGDLFAKKQLQELEQTSKTSNSR